jgi:hypothetical protein
MSIRPSTEHRPRTWSAATPLSASRSTKYWMRGRRWPTFVFKTLWRLEILEASKSADHF